MWPFKKRADPWCSQSKTWTSLSVEEVEHLIKQLHIDKRISLVKSNLEASCRGFVRDEIAKIEKGIDLKFKPLSVPDNREYRLCPLCSRVQIVQLRSEPERWYCYHDGRRFVYQMQEDPVAYMGKNFPEAAATKSVSVAVSESGGKSKPLVWHQDNIEMLNEAKAKNKFLKEANSHRFGIGDIVTTSNRDGDLCVWEIVPGHYCEDQVLIASSSGEKEKWWDQRKIVEVKRASNES